MTATSTLLASSAWCLSLIGTLLSPDWQPLCVEWQAARVSDGTTMCGYFSERHSLSLLLPGNVYRVAVKQSACLLPELFVLQLSHCCSSANLCMAANSCCWLSGAILDCRSLVFRAKKRMTRWKGMHSQSSPVARHELARCHATLNLQQHQHAHGCRHCLPSAGRSA